MIHHQCECEVFQPGHTSWTTFEAL